MKAPRDGMQRDPANHRSRTRLEVLEPHPHPPATLCLHQALPTPRPEIPAVCTAAPSSPPLRAGRAGGAGREPFRGAAVLPASRGWGRRDRLCGGGRAVTAILATDLASGTGSAGDGRAALIRAPQEPSRRDKIQPGLTRTESRWTEAGKQMDRRKFGCDLKAPKCLVRKTHTTGSCLSGRRAHSQPRMQRWKAKDARGDKAPLSLIES